MGVLMWIVVSVMLKITYPAEANMELTLTLQSVFDSAKKVYPDKPVLAQLAATQAILESNLVVKPSKLAVECNNLFGIKDTDFKNYKAYWTTECDERKCRRIMQNFECYSSIEDCFTRHRWLMMRPRYTKVWNAKDVETAFKEVKLGGYATDPKYTSKLLSTYKLFILPLTR